MVQQPLVGQDFHDGTQTHHTRSDASGRVISQRQRPLPYNTQHSQEADIYASGGIRTRNPRKWTGADPRHWDRLLLFMVV
jgi:hypothetical protein